MTSRSKRGTTSMALGGLGLTLHSPPANKTKRDARGQEVANNLTPPAPVTVYSVDDFPNCPADWKRGNKAENLAAFFMKIKVGNQLWFDMRASANHAHDVAAAISCQRVNAISGRPIKLEPGLEQYYYVCPKHNLMFEGESKFCPECKREWPHQNYVATTTVEPHAFWHDGFPDPVTGQIREFVFTEDMARGVAAHVIGEERTNAFGVGLYLSARPKPMPNFGYRRTLGGGFESPDMGVLESFGAMKGGMRMMSAPPIEVAAGALIKQEVKRDEKRLDYWQRDPSAYFVIYYVGEEEFASIVGSDKAEDESAGDGFLGGMPVGNE